MIVFTRRVSDQPRKKVQYHLSLTAEERLRSRHSYQTDEGQSVHLNLPRGTALKDGDWLESDAGDVAQVFAKPEPVFTVTAATSLALLQAAYHLGNRHVSLEITNSFLRLSPDPVLQKLLLHRGLHVLEEIAPFQPETGAYEHQH